MSFFRCALFLFLLNCASPWLRAQTFDFAYSDLERRIASLEAAERVDRIDTVLEGGPPAVHQAQHTEDIVPCDCDFCTQQCHDSFWYSGVELTIFKPTIATGALNLEEDTGGVGPRVYLGWEAASGFGVRTRFWGIEAEGALFDPLTGPTPLSMQTTAARFDFDLYRNFRFENGSLLVGAGVSGAGLEYSLISPGLTQTMETIGAGVSVFAEGRHRFYHSDRVDWALITRGRYAMTTGTVTDSDFPGVELDGNLNVGEAAFGVEFERRFQRCSFVAQYLMETQTWSPTDMENVNFLGSTVRLGLTW